MNFEITTIPAIVAIVYTIMDITKTALGGDEKFKRFIPLISCVLGGLIGVGAFFFAPSLMPEIENVIIAVLIGCASGLSATGVNQVFKQLSGKISVPTDTTDKK